MHKTFLRSRKCTSKSISWSAINFFFSHNNKFLLPNWIFLHWQDEIKVILGKCEVSLQDEMNPSNFFQQHQQKNKFFFSFQIEYLKFYSIYLYASSRRLRYISNIYIFVDSCKNPFDIILLQFQKKKINQKSNSHRKHKIKKKNLPNSLLPVISIYFLS